MATSSRKARTLPLPNSESLFGHLPVKGALNAKGVHETRRSLKRARAELRLLEETGVGRAGSVRRRLSRLARGLSPLRDSTVAARKARKLSRKLRGQTRNALLRVAAAVPTARSSDWWRRWHQRLSELRPSLDALVHSPLSRRAVRKGLSRSIRRTARQARRIRADSDIDDVHEWRKRIVVLREHFRIVAPILGSRAEKRFKQLDRIADSLGAATDLRPLLAALAFLRRPPVSRAVLRELVSLIRRRQSRAVKKGRKRWQKLEKRLAA